MSDRTRQRGPAAAQKTARADGIPDMRAIRQLPIPEVARALDLRFGSNGLIHCWYPDKHQHGDRTASVGIQKTLNRVKCFGCGSRPMGPLDLVKDVLGFELKDAADWIAARFEVPRIPPRKHIQEPGRIIHTAGFETAMGLLIRSGLWAKLSPVTQRVVSVLLELAEFRATAASEEEDKQKSVCISYRALGRYATSSAGRPSPSALSKALAELVEMGWLRREDRVRGLLRKVASYHLTPFSESVLEYANATVAELKKEIAAEKELREQERRKRLNAIATVASTRKPIEKGKQGAGGYY